MMAETPDDFRTSEREYKTLLDYWLVLYRRRASILVVFLLSVITAGVLSKVIPPVYEAKAVCYIPTASPAVPFMAQGATEKMARDLLVPSIKEEDAAPYIGILKSIRIAEYAHKQYPKKSVVKMLRSDMDFELSNEYMIRIYARDRDPQLAADIANAYAANLNVLLQEASLKSHDVDTAVIESQFGATAARLDASKEELRKFEEKNNLASVDEEIKQLTEQRAHYYGQVQDAEIGLREINEKVNSYSEQLRKEESLVSQADLVLTSPVIDSLKQRLADLAGQIAAASSEGTGDLPEVKRLKSQYDDTSSRLRNELQNIIGAQLKPNAPFYEQLRQGLVGVLIDRSRMEATKKANLRVVERLSEGLRRLAKLNSEWGRLTDAVDQVKKTNEQLKLVRQEAEMQKARPIQYVVNVDQARPPPNPTFPIMWLNLVVSVPFGLCAGVLYALFLESVSAGRRVSTWRLARAILSREGRARG